MTTQVIKHGDGAVTYHTSFGHLSEYEVIDEIPAVTNDEYDGFSEGMFSFKDDYSNDRESDEGYIDDSSEEDYVVHWNAPFVRLFCDCNTFMEIDSNDSPEIFHIHKGVCEHWNAQNEDWLPSDGKIVTIEPIINLG